MENLRETTQVEQEVMNYLNELRSSGSINMFGAAPVVESMFGLGRREARDIVTLWMENFNEESNYETVKA